MQDFIGKTALITGAAGGIGAAAAQLLARRGAAVVVADVKAAVHDTAARITADGGRAQAVQADCASDEGVAEMIATALAMGGRIDVLFANAGITGGMVPRLDTSSVDFLEVLRINLLGPWIAIRDSLPHMAQGGAIVCTASVAGIKAGAGPIPYSASKAGVVSLVQTTAMALSGRGIRVNGIAPGLIETPMTAPLFDDARARGREGKIGQLNPLRRAGQADEVAEAAVWLASQAAGYVNGQVLAVDGGLSAQLPFTPKWSG